MKPKLIIVMDGGLIQEIITDTDINVAIIDHDIDGAEEDKLKTLKDTEGNKMEVYFYTSDPVTLSEKITNHYWRQLKKD